MKLDSKIVVIVGGSQGIGKAISQEMLTKAATVIIVSKNNKSASAAAAELGCDYEVADVRNEAELREVAEKVAKKYGRIDVWINGAGVFKVFPKGDLIDKERSSELFDTNFMGVVYGTRAAAKYLSSDGLIITLLSSAALDASRAVGAKLYAASKWAVRGWIDAFRAETPNIGKRMLAVYPGGTKTHLHDEALPEAFDQFMEPEYVAQKIVANVLQDQPELDQVIRRPSA